MTGRNIRREENNLSVLKLYTSLKLLIGRIISGKVIHNQDNFPINLLEKLSIRETNIPSSYLPIKPLKILYYQLSIYLSLLIITLEHIYSLNLNILEATRVLRLANKPDLHPLAGGTIGIHSGNTVLLNLIPRKLFSRERGIWNSFIEETSLIAVIDIVECKL